MERLPAKRPSEEEAAAIQAAAFANEQAMKAANARVHESWWQLAEAIHDCHRNNYWRALGYERLNDFLAQPDLGISRSWFLRLSSFWEELVVKLDVAPARLAELEPGKVQEVVPAIAAGTVTVERGLKDAESLGKRDLREQYRPKTDEAADPDAPLKPEDEKDWKQCELCGSWYVPGEEP